MPQERQEASHSFYPSQELVWMKFGDHCNMAQVWKHQARGLAKGLELLCLGVYNALMPS